MKKMKRLIWLLPVIMAVLVTSCLKDDPNERTIVLLGTESDVKSINEVIPSGLLEFIANSGSMAPAPALDLPTGITPPDIQGEFVFKPVEQYAGNGTFPIPNDSICFRFGGEATSYLEDVELSLHAGDMLIQGTDTLALLADTTITVTETVVYYPEGQNNMIVPCSIFGDVPDKEQFKRKDVMGYVMGERDNFTAYFVVDYDCEESTSGAEYTLTRGYIVTGTITQEGIEHAVVACINIKVEQTASSVSLPDNVLQSLENKIFVYRVQATPNAPFGLAVRKNWY